MHDLLLAIEQIADSEDLLDASSYILSISKMIEIFDLYDPSDPKARESGLKIALLETVTKLPAEEQTAAINWLNNYTDLTT